MNAMQANSAVRGLIFAVQKARSDITEALGEGEVATALLKDLHPFLFGDTSILPRLLDWQARCRKTESISGMDMYNLVRFIEMKDPAILALLPMYGYTDVSPANVQWFGQTWPYLTDGYS